MGLLQRFVPAENGIYYIGRREQDRKYPLFFQFSSNTSRLLTKIEGFLDFGFSVSPDRQAIFIRCARSNDSLRIDS